MHNIILNLTKAISDPQNAPKLLVGTGQNKTHLCVVLTADRGLCGGFNSNICKLAKTNFRKIIGEGKNFAAAIVQPSFEKAKIWMAEQDVLCKEKGANIH